MLERYSQDGSGISGSEETLFKESLELLLQKPENEDNIENKSTEIVLSVTLFTLARQKHFIRLHQCFGLRSSDSDTRIILELKLSHNSPRKELCVGKDFSPGAIASTKPRCRALTAINTQLPSGAALFLCPKNGAQIAKTETNKGQKRLW